MSPSHEHSCRIQNIRKNQNLYPPRAELLIHLWYERPCSDSRRIVMGLFWFILILIVFLLSYGTSSSVKEKSLAFPSAWWYQINFLYIYVSMLFIETFLYSCNNITTTVIQISRLFYFGFFSKTNHQMII